MRQEKVVMQVCNSVILKRIWKGSVPCCPQVPARFSIFSETPVYK